MHNTRNLKLRQLHGIQATINLIILTCDMSNVFRGKWPTARRRAMCWYSQSGGRLPMGRCSRSPKRCNDGRITTNGRRHMFLQGPGSKENLSVFCLININACLSKFNVTFRLCSDITI